MVDLSGRTAFVTAGSRGIGRAICLKLTEAGADVGINYQSNHHAAAEVAAQIQAKGRRAGTYQFDVSDWVACQTGVTTVLSELGRIDILINNAGLGGSTIGLPSIANVTMEQCHRLIGVNLWGAIHMCKLLVEQMREAERGDIIMISSALAQVLLPNQGPYNISKAGMEALAHTLAKEEYPYGTRVNIVAPGFVETDMGKANLQRHPAIRDHVTAFGQLVQPEDVANAVVFLCSAQAHLITDQRINVDGGEATRRPRA
jgi:NAD(P)-dependent dehydrogenase (short-subunit alcohol dehydrogenase family)